MLEVVLVVKNVEGLKQMNIFLSDDLHRRLKVRAAQEMITMRDLVSRAVEEYVGGE